jgi:hypothetical protein
MRLSAPHRGILRITETGGKTPAPTLYRWANSEYLSAGLRQIPGVQPVQLPPKSRSAWSSYAFRYDAAQFNGLLKLQLHSGERLVQRGGWLSTGRCLVEIAGEEDRCAHVGLEAASEVECEVVSDLRSHVG